MFKFLIVAIVLGKSLENLYPMVFPITYDDVATGHNGDTFKTLELSVSRTPGPESPEEGSIRMEDLDSVVARISNYDVALVVDSNTPWELELPILRTFFTERRYNSSINIEDLNPVVVGVRD